MTMTLEQHTEVALPAADVWTVPGEWNTPVPLSDHGFGSGDPGEARLLADLNSAFSARRLIDAKIARHAVDADRMMTNQRAGVPSDSRPDSHRSVAELLVDIGRIPLADAHRFTRVGTATEPHTSLHGEVLAAEFALLRRALDAGSIPVESANHIITALTQATPRADPADLLAAEDALVAFAAECPADLVRKVACSWRDALDVDGVEPREKALAALTCLRRTLRPNGMKRYVLDADPLSAAYLDAAIDVHVGASIRRPGFTGASVDATADVGPGAEAGADVTAAEDEALFAPRSIAQLAAEAIIDFARHGIACTNTDIPLRATTIVVRMTLDSLLTGIGDATTDGIEQPISAGTVRRLAADADVIPMVLGGDSDLLDLGTTQRLFSRAQKLALAERFGGCAWRNCTHPPSHTEAHHIRWWTHDGESDLRNGILLCSRHHHEVHRNNWLIDVRENVPWFIPPSSIDPRRTPRRGGKAAPLA
ncbi:HNH endonuclease signature motif containing protein [Lacisediminihabitans sp. FW035]